MESWSEIGIAAAASMAGLVALGANILGLPGNWAMVLLGVMGLWWRDPAQVTHVGWIALIAMVAGALLGEIVEFAASALGASRAGGSRRATVMAIGGSILGAVAGLFFGAAIPIPVVGSIVGSLLLGAAGAFGGAVAGERWTGKDWDSSIQVGNAAFWGRLFGTAGKALCGTMVLGIFLIAIWF